MLKRSLFHDDLNRDSPKTGYFMNPISIRDFFQLEEASAHLPEIFHLKCAQKGANFARKKRIFCSNGMLQPTASSLLLMVASNVLPLQRKYRVTSDILASVLAELDQYVEIFLYSENS